MGGCRCSYRKCTTVTDAKTHFFHYPVLDKDRCHSWLVNARRLDFINLTKNQLKNRVVCQNHFLPDMFMNYRCDRLVYHAVPTEDGPSPPETVEETKKFVNLASQISKNLWVFMDSENISINQTIPVNKEDSVLIVNDSPITGYSFTEPGKMKLKMAEPYIEFLTRKQIGLIDMAKRRLIEKSNGEGTNVSKVIKKANESKQTVAESRRLDPVSPVKTGNEVVVTLAPGRHVKKASPRKNEPSAGIEINVISDTMITQPISIPSNTVITPVRKVVPSFVIQKRLTQTDVPVENVKPPVAKVIPHADEKTNVTANGNVTVNDNLPDAEIYSEIAIPEKLPNNYKANIFQTSTNNVKNVVKTKPLKINVPRLLRSSQAMSVIPTPAIGREVSKDEKLLEAIAFEDDVKEEQVKAVETVIGSTLLKKIDDNTREIAELRRLLLKDSEDKVAMKRKKDDEQCDEETVKLRLYKEISAFISPKLIKLVHDELFPSTLRFSDESPRKHKLRNKKK